MAIKSHRYIYNIDVVLNDENFEYLAEFIDTENLQSLLSCQNSRLLIERLSTSVDGNNFDLNLQSELMLKYAEVITSFKKKSMIILYMNVAVVIVSIKGSL